MLELNFECLGSAADMVRNGDFAIQDEGTDADINLSQPWELCFFPRQRVNMSMIFTRPHNTDSNCPKCKTVADGKSDHDIEWYMLCQRLNAIANTRSSLKCGLIFRRIADADMNENGTPTFA